MYNIPRFFAGNSACAYNTGLGINVGIAVSPPYPSVHRSSSPKNYSSCQRQIFHDVANLTLTGGIECSVLHSDVLSPSFSSSDESQKSTLTRLDPNLWIPESGWSVGRMIELGLSLSLFRENDLTEATVKRYAVRMPAGGQFRACVEISSGHLMVLAHRGKGNESINNPYVIL